MVKAAIVNTSESQEEPKPRSKKGGTRNYLWDLKTQPDGRLVGFEVTDDSDITFAYDKAPDEVRQNRDFRSRAHAALDIGDLGLITTHKTYYRVVIIDGVQLETW